MNNALPPIDFTKSEAFASNSKKTATAGQSFSDSYKDVKREIDAETKDKNVKKTPVNTAENDKSATKEPAVSDKDLLNEKNSPEASRDDSITSDQATIEESKSNKAPSSEVENLVANEILKPLSGHTIDTNQSNTVSELKPMSLDASNEELLASLRSLVDITSNNSLESIFTQKELSVLQQYIQQVEGGNTLPLSTELVSVLDKLKQLVNGNQTDNFASPKTSTRLESVQNVLSSLIDDEQALVDNADTAASSEVKIKQQNEQFGSLVSANTSVGATLGSQDGVVSNDVLQDKLITQILEGELVNIPHENKIHNVATISENSLASTTPSPIVSPFAKAQLSINVPFQQGQWGEQVSNKVMWMSSQGLKEAEIHLDPPELGPLQVKVSVANEQAHVSFVVQHSSVREALDQNAMRLRDMFEGEGIDLVDVDVSDQSENSEKESDGTENNSHAMPGDDSETLVSSTVTKHTLEGYSLINTYV